MSPTRNRRERFAKAMQAMFRPLSSGPTCPVANCHRQVKDLNVPCAECRSAFGRYLRLVCPLFHKEHDHGPRPSR